MHLVHDDDRPLSIELLRVGRRVVLAVAGEVDVASVDELNSAVRDAEASQPLELWIDLSDVEFMDSTGLTALLVAHRARHAGLVLICPDGSVRRLLRLAGVDRIVPVHPNRAAAQAAS
jgi:anti-anti-sigma factor